MGISAFSSGTKESSCKRSRGSKAHSDRKDERLERVDIKFINSALRSKMSKLLHILKRHYRQKEHEKKEQRLLRKKREEADKKEAEENQGGDRYKDQGMDATFTSHPIEIIEEKKEAKKRGFLTSTVSLNDIPEVLKVLQYRTSNKEGWESLF